VASTDLITWSRSRLSPAAASVAATTLVAVLALNQLVTNVLLQQFFVTTGGRGFWSDSLYTLAQTLQTRFANRPVMAMDWGFRRPIEFLTKDQTNLSEMFEYAATPSSKFEDLSTVLLRDPDNVYLFHAPDTTAFRGHWDIFERAALKAHKDLVLEAALYERDGITNTLVYTAQPAPRSFTIPPSLNRRGATFDNGLTLLGGDAQYDPANREVAVWLQWQSNADALTNDTVLLHIVDQSNGKVIVVGDKQPVYGSYPFSEWQHGEVVADPHWITLPETLAPGVYQVRVGVYDPQTGVRHAIKDPKNDAAGNSLMLQTFEVR
jgi:hypothetical protein